MPLYDYKCPECGHEEEKLVPINDADLQLCAVCKDEIMLIRQVAHSTGGFRMDGKTPKSERSSKKGKWI